MINPIKYFVLFIVLILIAACVDNNDQRAWKDGGNEYLIVKSVVHITGEIQGAIIYSGGVLNFKGVSTGAIIINKGGILILEQKPDERTVINGFNVVNEDSGHVDYFNINTNIDENSGQRIRQQAALSQLSNELVALSKMNRKISLLREKYGLNDVSEGFSITFSGKISESERIQEYKELKEKVLAEKERVKGELEKLESINR